MILYFSGTGNSRYIANELGTILDDEVVSINQYLKTKSNGNFYSGTPYIFVTPTYMSRMPMKVEEFIRSSSFKGNKNAYYIFSAGQFIGNAYKYCQKLCTQKKLLYRGTSSIAMPANYVLMYDVLPKEKAKEEVGKVDPAIQRLAEQIKNMEKINLDPQMSGHKSFSMIAPLFNSWMVSAKGFHADSTCTGCGRCESICPLDNIKISNKNPVWGTECMHCMACISVCPHHSINYGKKTKDRNRYYLEN